MKILTHIVLALFATSLFFIFAGCSEEGNGTQPSQPGTSSIYPFLKVGHKFVYEYKDADGNIEEREYSIDTVECLNVDTNSTAYKYYEIDSANAYYMYKPTEDNPNHHSLLFAVTFPGNKFVIGDDVYRPLVVPDGLAVGQKWYEYTTPNNPVANGFMQVVELGVSVEVDSVTTYKDCIRIEDYNNDSLYYTTYFSWEYGIVKQVAVSGDEMVLKRTNF